MNEEILALLETLAVAAAVAGSALVVSRIRYRRRLGFIAFLVSSLASAPLMYQSGLYSYVLLQGFYLCTSVLGIINTFNNEEP